MATAQKINAEKTAMVYSHNVPERCKDKIQSLWGGGLNQQIEKYLGLPLLLVDLGKKPLQI